VDLNIADNKTRMMLTWTENH